MDLLSKTKDIVGIRMGHECDSYATWYIGEQRKKIEAEEIEPVTKIYDSYIEGFETGIKFLANYLKEFGIDVVIHEEVVKTNEKEHWYSGTIIEH